MSDAAGWLRIADNERTWARLSDNLALADGFELVFAVVVGPPAAAALEELLEGRARELGRRFVRIDARDEDVLARLTNLGEHAALIVLDTIAASRRATTELERCLLELNPRRDLLAKTIPGPVVVIVRPDGLRRFADLAPDLFSVHTASFRYFGGSDLGLEERPEWLLGDHEFVGLLGIDPSFGYADRSRAPKLVREPPQPPEPPTGHEELLARLEARLVPGGERIIEITGASSVERTASLARAVRMVEARWDRVIWLDCRHAWNGDDDRDPVVDAVLEVLAPEETPPFDAVDARERFVELTTIQAVLIIADGCDCDSRTMPGPRSCLITTPGLGHPRAPAPGVRDLEDARDDKARLESELLAALRHGRAEQARELRDELGMDGLGGPLLDMLALLRPVEWDPSTELGRTFAAFYAMGEAEPEIEAALRLGLDMPIVFDDAPLPDAPPARAAVALRCEPVTPEALHALLATLDESRELDRLAAHFIWSRLAWLDILANDWSSFEQAFAEVERSARAWGISYALVRVRLLELTACDARGEFDRVAAKLPNTLAAVDRTYGTRSRIARALLRRAIRIYTELDRSEDAERARAQLRARRRPI